MGFNSGSGGGNGQISQAGDVAFSSLVNKQVLTYDSTTNKWKNATPQASSGGSTDIEFSPYDYGFVDGMANATSSVQATITAAMQNGGTVKLPLGNINVTTLNLDYANMPAQNDNGAPYGYPGPIILGQGMRNTRIVQIAGSTGNVLNVKGKTGTATGPANNNKITGTYIRDLEIVGTSTGGHGIFMQAVVNCGVEHVWIRSAGKSGIYIARETFVSGENDEYCYALTFRSVKIVSVLGWGFECSGTNSIGASMYDIETIGCGLGGFKLAPTNMTLIGCQAIGCGKGSVNGRGLLVVRNTNQSSVNSALTLLGFRSEENSMAGGYEVEIRGGIGYSIIGANIFATNGAHGLGIGVQNTGVTNQFTQELSIDGGFIGITQSVTPSQQAIILGADARKTVIRTPRFQNGANSISLGDVTTDNGFQTTVIRGITYAEATA
jgi:hypothetical protein